MDITTHVFSVGLQGDIGAHCTDMPCTGHTAGLYERLNFTVDICSCNARERVLRF